MAERYYQLTFKYSYKQFVSAEPGFELIIPARDGVRDDDKSVKRHGREPKVHALRRA